MQSGKLDRRISFQSSTLVKNSIGEWIPTWTTVLNRWAAVEFTDTREKYEASELTAPGEVTFRTRYNATINEKMRIVYDGKSYDILHIAEINRREGLKIIALKKDNTSAVVPQSGIVTLDLSITDQPADTQVFSVTLTGPDTIITKYITQQNPAYIVDVPFGTYTVTQAAVDGYLPVSITPGTFTLSANNLHTAIVVTNEIDLTT
jgi:SPP1 family predicted phage head-tail adaptor